MESCSYLFLFDRILESECNEIDVVGRLLFDTPCCDCLSQVFIDSIKWLRWWNSWQARQKRKKTQLWHWRQLLGKRFGNDTIFKNLYLCISMNEGMNTHTHTYTHTYIYIYIYIYICIDIITRTPTYGSALDSWKRANLKSSCLGVQSSLVGRLVSLFNGISIFMGYLTPKSPF